MAKYVSAEQKITCNCGIEFTEREYCVDDTSSIAWTFKMCPNCERVLDQKCKKPYTLEKIVDWEINRLQQRELDIS